MSGLGKVRDQRRWRRLLIGLSVLVMSLSVLVDVVLDFWLPPAASDFSWVYSVVLCTFAAAVFLLWGSRLKRQLRRHGGTAVQWEQRIGGVALGGSLFFIVRACCIIAADTYIVRAQPGDLAEFGITVGVYIVLDCFVFIPLVMRPFRVNLVPASEHAPLPATFAEGGVRPTAA